jgi:hypothetical protein
METVIGLGGVGCKLANMFKAYPQYKVITIDSQKHDEHTIVIPRRETTELYEETFPELQQLKDVDSEVLFIVGGSGRISGASLKLLKQVSKNPINVLYISPEKQLLNDTSIKQNRVVCSVLQEYTRSGMFKRMILVSNALLDEMAGDVPVADYTNSINNAIVSAVHTINFFEHITPQFSLLNSPRDCARLTTIGVYDLDTDTGKQFFDLTGTEDQCYYFGISEESLKTDVKLFKNIKQKILQKSTESCKTSFAIYSIPHKQNYCFTQSFSRLIQTP